MFLDSVTAQPSVLMHGCEWCESTRFTRHTPRCNMVSTVHTTLTRHRATQRRAQSPAAPRSTLPSRQRQPRSEGGRALRPWRPARCGAQKADHVCSSAQSSGVLVDESCIKEYEEMKIRSKYQVAPRLQQPRAPLPPYLPPLTRAPLLCLRST